MSSGGVGSRMTHADQPAVQTKSLVTCKNAEVLVSNFLSFSIAAVSTKFSSSCYLSSQFSYPSVSVFPPLYVNFRNFHHENFLKTVFVADC